jgi:filamentous hemagglutinin family protein
MEHSRIRLAVAAALASAATLPAEAAPATLPVPCIAGVCGANNPFVMLGQASATQAGNRLTVNQTSQNAVLNWQSFNISANGTVQFVQPNSSSVALNRILDANPTTIFGVLTANGRVYLINGNGIVFGKGAQVNVGSLVASTLQFNGLVTNPDGTIALQPLLGPGQAGQAAFQQFSTGSGAVSVQQGATLTTPEGGQILLFAPKVTNEGTIVTPGGQTVLAAGTQVYLAASTDPSLRGLLVEIASDGSTPTTVTNGTAGNGAITNPAQLIGQISADRGNVTLAGMVVNQLGRVSATTSVNENGSIRLQARSGTVTSSNGNPNDAPGTGGTLTLGAHSATEVLLDTADTSTTTDSVPQPKSDVALFGANIDILADSTVRATSGSIEAHAAVDQNVVDNGLSATPDASRIYVAAGADLDVSGASVTLPVTDNVIAVQLRATELADSPLQRNGPLHGQTVSVDVRAHGTNADDTTWQGTPLANVSGEIAAIQRNVAERNLTGGTITLNSQGDAIVAPGAVLNLAGGQINYTGGVVTTTTLLTSTGQGVPIAAANPNLLYIGTLDSTTIKDPRWGTTQTFGGVTGSYEQGYVQGFDAGTLNLSAPRFVLEGTIDGAAQAGLLQRLPAQAPLATGQFLGYDGLPQLYRNYDQVPLGATLNIGGSHSLQTTNFVVASVTVDSQSVYAGLKGPGGAPFDPLTDPLPGSLTASLLNPQLFGPNGFSQASIETNGKFLLPESVAVRLPAGGTFAIQASSIDLEGRIDAPGGTISARALPTFAPDPDGVSLTLGAHAALTAAGEWVNDNPMVYGGAVNTAPLFINGGSVTLTSQGLQGAPSVLILKPGSLIDVSGGAQLTASGKVNPGTGGKITLAALPQPLPQATPPPPQPAELELGATLRGYALTKGGTLTIGAGAVCIAASNCSGNDPNTLWLPASAFSSGGFSRYVVNAEQGGLSVAPGTTLTLQQLNYQLPANFAGLPNAATLPTAGAPALLPQIERLPVSLTLNQTVLPNGYNFLQEFTLEVTPETPSLVIGAGADLVADPGATLALSSNTRMLIDGTLSAPGGNINLTLALTGGVVPAGYAPTQAIWLGSTAVLDAHGVPQIQLNSSGMRTGSVLDGGTVNISATIGQLELLPGSLIDVSGGSGTIDVAQPGRAPKSETVGSGGGSINLTAAEGMVVNATLRAAGGGGSGTASQAEGGSISVSLNGLSVASSLAQPALPGPFANEIVVSQTLAPIVTPEGGPLPDFLVGKALVSADTLAGSGFDSVTLQARPFASAASGAAVQGEIAFSGNVSLSATRLLALDAQTYTVSPGGTAHLSAPYLEFGNADTFALALADPTPGSGRLELSGGFVELYGMSTLQGIGQFVVDSSGDLRLRGIQGGTSTGSPSTVITGGLITSGDVSLTAGQVYPSTLSQFLIASGVSSLAQALADQVPAGGTISVHGTQGSNTDLLSAGGSLELLAANVEQAGVLRAPLGTIYLHANSVDLAPGSLTTTSADGLTIPFGTTQGGFDWVYPLLGFRSVVYGTDGIAPPAQHVVLSGASVGVQKGAVVDVSGGGNLGAYEWIPGVGGTEDVLSQSVRPDQFAILPSLHASVAPFDPNASAGSGLAVGDSVYLSGVPGLPAGTYTLLPSRYALLPGAFLVSPAGPKYQDIAPGQLYPAQGGGWIASGYLTVAGTDFGGTRTAGFSVVPAAIVLQQAQYTTTGGNAFFANQAAQAGQAPSRLPEDSGVLGLLASASLSVAGTLRTHPADGGLGAAVDISSAQIVVAQDASAPVQGGQLLLTTTSLEQLNAQSLLIGGQRNASGAISDEAQTVTFAGGATLTAPEILVAASEQITVSSGATLTGSGTAPAVRSYSLQGDGAFLAVSSGGQASVTRANATGASGVLDLAAGSTLSAAKGSVYLDASASVLTGGTLDAAGGDLGLQSTLISIGTPPAGTGGTVLDPALLAGGALRNVLLSSGSTVNFYGSSTLDAQNLAIDAMGLTGYGAAGDTASVALTGDLTLTNTHGAPAAGGTGSGNLSLSAANVNLASGTLALSGFDTVAIAAQGALTGTANGGLAVSAAGPGTGGNLNLTAARVTTASGVATVIQADGAVALATPAQPAKLAAVSDLGGSLAVSGASVSLDTAIDMPSGRVVLTSTSGPLTLGTHGVISVAGLERQYAGATVPTPGGAVFLTSASDLTLASGSRIDVSASGAGMGGVLTLTAVAGQVTAAGDLVGAGSGAQGAALAVDAQGFDFGALNGALNTGGFSGTRTFRLRGPGDLVVAAGDTVTAHAVSLEADQGGIDVQGAINASGSQGGSVLLAASGNLTLGGSIDAHATAAGGAGGRVALETAAGELHLAGGSVVNVAGGGADASGHAGEGGTVLLRVPQATVAAVTSGGTGVSLAGTIEGSRRTTLEAFRVYTNSSGEISASDVAADPSNPMFADAQTFMANAAAITAALGRSNDAAFLLAPGIEIDAVASAANPSGALTLATPWNLYGDAGTPGWRFGANLAPGVLTLRAAGALTIASQLSDGFVDTATFTLPQTPSSSWSYRLVGGADLAAANPLAVSTATADVTIAACSANCTPPGTDGGRGGGVLAYTPNMVRTGDGFIDVAASGNFTLGSEASVLYTAGVAGPGITLPGQRGGSLQNPAYPTGGGDIDIAVAGNVLGFPGDQFVGAWLWRTAGTTSDPTSSAVAWTVNFATFQQGVAALGGGNVNVVAGGDITDFSASIPSIGRQVGGLTMADNAVQVVGGGTLNVAAGGSILGGSYFVGLGSATLRAGDNVGVSMSDGLAPLLGLGDASVAVGARGSVALAGILNPTLLNPGLAQSGSSSNPYWSTYGPGAKVTLTASGGDVQLPDDDAQIASVFGPSFTGGIASNNYVDPQQNAVALDVMPPTLSAYALAGDVTVGRALVLTPSASGTLQLIADRNVNVGAGAAAAPSQVTVSDADPALLPSAANPQTSLQTYADALDVIDTVLTNPALADQHGAVPVHLGTGTVTANPVRLVARTGDVAFSSAIGTGLWSAQPVEVLAGRDVVNAVVVAQNLLPGDVTTLSAGRDIVYPLVRDPQSGKILPSFAQISVDGPGEVQLTAGRDVNLGTSAGVTTRANLINPALPASGAGVSILAGVAGHPPQLDAFISKYIEGSDQFDSELVAFVEGVSNEQNLSSAQAKQQFAAMDAPLQTVFVEQVFFDLLRTSGRAAAASGSGDFSGAFAALTTLFPGANPDLGAGETNPYAGNIELFFSRVYTLAGGNVSLLAPGGEINVGLAQAPSAFGVSKSPDQLGLVAQTTGDISALTYKDFEVNQSRVFTAAGGNILVWSTEGDIDAGRGSKTALSAPPAAVLIDPQTGAPIVTLRAPLTGSGIQTLASTPGSKPGDVDLYAPHGVVNANDAGIVAGNLTIAATAVLGTNNISVSGTSVGVPVETAVVSPSTAAAASAAGGQQNAETALAAAAQDQASKTPQADSALGWLDVFVLGFGEETCKAEDAECLKRQHK